MGGAGLRVGGLQVAGGKGDREFGRVVTEEMGWADLGCSKIGAVVTSLGVPLAGGCSLKYNFNDERRNMQPNRDDARLSET